MAAVLSLAVVPAFAAGAEYEVNALHDNGSGGCDEAECTLREAIISANAEPDFDRITFSEAGTIKPLDGPLWLRRPAVLDGYSAPGATAGDPTINIEGSLQTGGAGIVISGDVTVQGLRVTGWKNSYPLSVAEIDGHPVIRGNVIGGLTEAERNTFGVHVNGDDTTIGGPDPADRNLIFGTSSYHVDVSGDRTVIQGNYLGTSGSPSEPARGSGGVYVHDGATGTLIGGDEPGEGNVISGSTGTGISIWGQSGTKIVGNRIGTSPDGISAIPNNSGGIAVFGPTTGVDILRNTIAFNPVGVSVYSNASGVRISGSSIHSNETFDIELSGSSGPEPNDPGDADTGANELQNHPVLASAIQSATGTTVSGELDSTSSSTFEIEVFANRVCGPRGFGPGEIPLASFEVTTDESGRVEFQKELPALPAGRTFLSSTATSPGGSTSEFSECLEAQDAEEPPAPDFKVTNLNGTGSGSLRQAIQEANGNPGHDTITFEVAGQIFPYTPLPPITDPVTLDGSSAPGATAQDPAIDLFGNHTPGAEGLDLRAESRIRNLGLHYFRPGTAVRIGPAAAGSTIEATEIGSGQPGIGGTGNETGIRVLAEDVTIGGSGKGNTITSSTGTGIILDAPGAHLIENRIGIGGASNFSFPNETGIRILEGADEAELVGNHVSANVGPGLHASDVEGLHVLGNRFGGASSGAELPNGIGILLEGTRNSGLEDNIVAGNLGPGIKLNDVEGVLSSDDRVLLNHGAGVEVAGDSSGVDFHASSFQANGGIGLDLGADGVTPNDPGDVDQGPNDLLNFPDLESVEYDAHVTEFKGSLDSTPESDFSIRLYASSSCDPSGFGEGEVEVGTLDVATDSAGHVSFTKTIGRLPAGRRYVSARSSSSRGSSEFSRCVTAVPAAPSYEVRSLEDDGDGICDSTCTLRDAILTANSTEESKTITFAVAGEIKPDSVLPAFQAPVVVDGLSAPGAAPGAPAVTISGANLSTGSGLTVSTPATISGLKLTGFTGGTAVRFEPGSSGSVLRASQIGSSSDLVAQNLRGVSINAHDVTIGGTNPAHRNVLTGSQTDNLLLSGGGGIRVLGNWIGTDGHATAFARSEAGIRLNGPLPGTVIGGDASGAGNVISGMDGWGIRMDDASGIELKSNLIGIATNRLTPSPNSRGGIFLDDSSGIISTGDRIAFNNGPGIRIEGASTANDFAEASIHSNAGLGIDLNADGVTPNDPGDRDLGPNGLQNFPELTSAEAIEGGIRITGAVDVRAPGGMAIDFYASAGCDPSGNGEGQRFLGTLSDHFPQSGPTEISVDLPFPEKSLLQITATATGNDGTSEFSICREATGFDPQPIIDPPPRVRAINGRVVVAAPIEGRVTVTLPDGGSRVLSEATAIPVGSKINATKGRVTLTAATAGDRSTQRARFWGGPFEVRQKRGQTLTRVNLVGGRDRRKICQGRQLRSKKKIRVLWGRGKGRFRSRGRRGAAGVRGTHWLTADRCDGTFFRVREGVVAVDDFGTKKRVVLRAGDTYLAKMPAPKKTRRKR